MVTVVYVLETGEVERITSVPTNFVVEQFDPATFGVFETEQDLNPTDANRFCVRDGALVQLEVPPDVLILQETRANILSRTDWYTIRHRDQLEAGATPSLSPEQFAEILNYRQALRDWPVSGDYNEAFPARPSWM